LNGETKGFSCGQPMPTIMASTMSTTN